MGFLRSLVDFSFSRFVTTEIVKFLYVLAILWHALTTLVLLIGAFTQDPAVGILALFLLPLYFFLAVLLSRVFLEVVVVVFRIADYLRDIRAARPVERWTPASVTTQRRD